MVICWYCVVGSECSADRSVWHILSVERVDSKPRRTPSSVNSFVFRLGFIVGLRGITGKPQCQLFTCCLRMPWKSFLQSLYASLLAFANDYGQVDLAIASFVFSRVSEMD